MNQSTDRPSKPFYVIHALCAFLAAATLACNQTPEESTEVSALTEAPTADAAFPDLSPEQLPDLMAEGSEHLNAGRVDEAIKVFEMAVTVQGAEMEDLHYNYALALAKKGRAKEAIQQYERALEIWPDYPEALNNLGNLLVKEKRFGEAIKYFQEAVEIEPDYAKGYNNLGTALGQDGRANEALLQFLKAVQIDPDYIEARYNLAMSYLIQDRASEAVVEFQEILRRKPDFAPARAGYERARLRAEAQGIR